MSLAVLIWSLYPLAASVGLQTMSSLDMILIVYFFSGFGAIFITLFYLWKNKLFKQAINIQKELSFNAYIPIVISGVAGILSHAFFIISLTLANKAGVSLLFESWPIIAVIATPMLMKKRWKEVSGKEFLIGVVALMGVAIIILTDDNLQFTSDSITSSFDYYSLGGYILAFAGAYMTAVLAVTRGTYSEFFKPLKDDIAASLISELFSRTISMFFISIVFIYLKDDLYVPNIDWGITAFIGLIIFVGGGALYTFALLKTNRPTIHIMYYFVPVLAVIWLWIAGESEINAGLFIGGAIIVVCNLYLFIAGRNAPLAEDL